MIGTSYVHMQSKALHYHGLQDEIHITQFKYVQHCVRNTWNQFSNNEFRPFLVDMRIEMCSVNNKTSKSLLQAVFAEIVKNHTNMNTPCPPQPAEYYFTNISVGSINKV